MIFAHINPHFGFKPHSGHFGFTVHLIFSNVIGVHIKPHFVTDGQTDKFFDTIYGGMWMFSFS